MSGNEHEGLLSHLGQETSLPACGRTWRLSRLELRHWNDWFAWARTVLPDPLEVAEVAVEKRALAEHRYAQQLRRLGKDADPEEVERLKHLVQTKRDEQQFITRTGLEKAASFLSFSAPETESLMNSIHGQCRLLYLVLQQHQPDITEQQAFEILTEIGQEVVQKKLNAAGGTVPRKNAEAPAAG